MRCHKCRQRFWVRSYAKPAVLGVLLLGGLGLLIGEMAEQGRRPAAADASSQDALYARAKAGDAQAELEIGMRYSQGDGFIKNPKEAAGWLSKAARHDSVEAQYQLGQALLEGRGVVQDFHAAFAWTEKAAQRGYAPAQYSLGELYRFGTGVTMDKAKAYLWYNLAAAQGVEEAAKARDSVAWQVKPDQLKAMQDEARRLSQQQVDILEAKPAGASPGTTEPGKAAAAAPAKPQAAAAAAAH